MSASKHLEKSNTRFRKALISPDIYGEIFSLTRLDAGLVLAGVATFVLTLLLAKGTLTTNFGFAISYILSALVVFKRALEGIRSGFYISEPILLLLGSIISAVSGHAYVSILIVLIYIGYKALESWLVERQICAADEVRSIIPEYAYVLRDEEFKRIKPRHIRKDDIFRVNSLEIIPTDGYVLDGMSTVDLSPLVKSDRTDSVVKGSYVYSGSVNMSDPIYVRASVNYENSLIGLISDWFRESCKEISEFSNKLIQRKKYILFVALLCSVVFGLIVPVFRGNWQSSAELAAILLLLGCSFGIVGAVDLCEYRALTELFMNGAILRDKQVLAQLVHTKCIIFNKTATLTEKAYAVTDVHPVDLSEEEFLSLINKIERSSKHPIAGAIRMYSGLSPAREDSGLSYTEIPGKGIVCVVNGNTFVVGNAAIQYDYGVACEVPDRGGTAVHLSVNGKYCGYILLENRLRKETPNVIENLKKLGIRNLVLLSCDLRSIVHPIATKLGFHVEKSELTPEAKISATRYMVENKLNNSMVLYIGNQMDEAKSAQIADIFLATDCMFPEAYTCEADILHFSDGISFIPSIIASGRRLGISTRICFGFFIISRLFILLMILFGICSPLLAATIEMFFSVLSYLCGSFIFERLIR